MVCDAGQRARQEEERRAVESVKCLIRDSQRRPASILMCARVRHECRIRFLIYIYFFNLTLFNKP